MKIQVFELDVFCIRIGPNEIEAWMSFNLFIDSSMNIVTKTVVLHEFYKQNNSLTLLSVSELVLKIYKLLLRCINLTEL